MPTCIYTHKRMNMYMSISTHEQRQVEEQRLISVTQDSHPLLYVAELELHPWFLHVVFMLLRNLMLAPFWLESIWLWPKIIRAIMSTWPWGCGLWLSTCPQLSKLTGEVYVLSREAWEVPGSMMEPELLKIECWWFSWTSVVLSEWTPCSCLLKCDGPDNPLLEMLKVMLQSLSLDHKNGSTASLPLNFASFALGKASCYIETKPKENEAAQLLSD